MSDLVDQLIARAREHHRAGEHALAEPLLVEALAARPGFPDLLDLLGVTCHALGRFDEAERAFEAALRINPGYTEAALNLCVTLNDRGKYEQAREAYARAVEGRRRPGPPAAPPEEAGAPGATRVDELDAFTLGKLANLHAELAAAYAGLRLHDAAAREYRQALALCPGFADLRVQLGVVLRDAGAHEAAVAELARAARERPGYAPAGLHLGVTLYALGRRDEAIAAWEAVRAHDPTNRSAGLYLRLAQDPAGPRPGTARR